MPTLIPEQLRAQVARWRGRRGWGAERVFAIRTTFPYDGDSMLDCDGFTVRVASCRSDLEARDLLSTLTCEGDNGLLLLMRTDEEGIGEDVRVRFAGKAMLTLDTREVLKEIYQASSIDPRISNDDALLDALVMAGSIGSGRKAPGGVLDLDFAWSVILRQPDLMYHRPDLVEVLRWSLDESRWLTVESLDDALVPSFFQWVGERAGGVVRCLETLFDTNQTGLYLPLGLVAGDLFHERLDSAEVAKGARIRIENYLNGQKLKVSEAAAWSRAAREVLAKRPAEERDRISGEVDAILYGIQVGELAHAFSWSKRGFKDRWRRFADDIDRVGKRKWETGSKSIYISLSQLHEHELASLQPARLKRAEMAARLVAFEGIFAGKRERAGGLSASAREFAENDSFVDWARFSLSWGDPVPEVDEAYGRLGRRLARARAESQISFGDKLCQWHCDNEQGSTGLVPIESAVSKYLAPLASERPVLLLVMDGMNFPAFHQICRSLEHHGWVAQRKSDEDFPSRVLSVLPSVTENSRWSLFAGKVQKGKRPTESVAFREHPALADLKSKGKPLLFTKGDLGAVDSASLSSKVREALAGSEHRVVAVVINAIDDQLKTGGQLSLDWNVPGIGILPTILEAAAQGKRLIVMTSDHGHIPEMENTRPIETTAEGEARYRYGQPSDDGERVFTGERITAATERPSVTLPVTETLRYGQKAAGYHGGACDLEALVPLAVFSSPGDDLPGYVAVDSPRPEWWNWKAVLLGDTTVSVPVAVPVPKASSKKKITNVDELPLFEEVGAVAGAGSEVAWLDDFFKSAVFAEQKNLLGKAAPGMDHLRKVLAALDANGDKLLIEPLARVIGEPSLRIQGILSRVARFTNVDSYEILDIDRDSQTVELNRKLLASQFQIKL